MDNIDKLLSEIKAEYNQAKPQQQQPKINVVKSFAPTPSKSTSFVDNLLE